MRIKNISLDNQPRERLEKQRLFGLSDAELLAIILQKGTKEENVIDMSNRLLFKYRIDKLSSCSLKELQKIKGIGKAKASQIIVLFEFNKRHHLAKQNGKPIKSAKDVYDYHSPKLSGLDRKHFIILHLDTHSRIIKDGAISGP